MAKKNFFILLALLWTGICQGGESPLEIAKKLQTTYEQTSSFSADFRQNTSIPMSRRQRMGAGTMMIQKPGLMRWDYQSPDEQILVSDGKTISMYFAQNKQMLVMEAREYLKADITYSFFAGTGNILNDFKVTKPEKNDLDQHFYFLKLIPKKNHPQVSSITVRIARDTFLINRLLIVDHFDSVTDLHFFNLKINEPKPLAFFSYTPPAGTEIISQ